MSSYLNLNIPDAKKVVKLKNIDEFYTSDKTKFYGVVYFIYFSKDPIIVRLSSKDESFSTLHGIDILSDRLIPVVGIIFKENPTNEELVGFITDYKKGIMKESVVEDYLNYLSEGPILVGAGVAAGQAASKSPVFRKILKAMFTDPQIAPTVYLMLFTTGLVAIAKWWYLIKRIINWGKEKYVEGPVERKLNQALFGTQTKDEPAFAMYSRLSDFVNHIIHGKQPAFIICGPPGMSKTYIVKRTFHFSGLRPGADYRIEKGGALGAAEVYSLLYYNRKRFLILDDFDTPLSNPTMVNLLKAITDSYDRRIISYPREKVTEVGGEGSTMPSAPSKFEFKGKLIIVTNLTKDQIDPALLSRAPAIEVKYNTQQVLDALENLLKFVNPKTSMEIKREVLDYILELHKEQPFIHVDFRSFKSSVDARDGGVWDWKAMVRTIVNYKE